jgi:dienelactone hydrolase
VVPRADNMYYLTNGTVEWHQITNASGEILTYYLYVPPHQAAPKKHPLILGIAGIGFAGFAWNADYQAFADGGYYFMYVERYQRDESQWGQDVLTVYESLAKNPQIDTNSVYLCGVSEGARSACDLLEENPNLWRGIILQSPLYLPDPVQLSGKKVFVDHGANDPAIDGRSLNPARFQDQAAKAGVPITLVCYPGEEHIIRTPPSQRERVRETLIFVNEP